MMKIKRIILGIVVGLLAVGMLVCVHQKVHKFDAPRIQSQIRMQEHKVEQIETFTQKIILVD